MPVEIVLVGPKCSRCFTRVDEDTAKLFITWHYSLTPYVSPDVEMICNNQKDCVARQKAQGL